MVNKRNHPQMALIHVRYYNILQFTQVYGCFQLETSIFFGVCSIAMVQKHWEKTRHESWMALDPKNDSFLGWMIPFSGVRNWILG